MKRYDVAIVGSGFAGSILARVLNQQGRRVLLLERGQHPRFALGESTTPLANFALERLAFKYRLPDLYHLSSHGRWLANLPELRRGLKRGFTFFHHRRGHAYRNSPANEARLLVAASPDDEIADTHWVRQDVDHHLVKRAVAEGVDYRDETKVEAATFHSKGVRIAARTRGGAQHFEAGVLVDGSGPRGILADSLSGDLLPRTSPVISGLLSAHFDQIRPFDEVVDLQPGPYPDERAAIHHLLDFGWMYVLPFDHGTVSAGMILRQGTQELKGIGLANSPQFDPTIDPVTAWQTLIQQYPSLAEQFQNARPVSPIRYTARLQHRFNLAAGPRWFLLPHTYAFADPLFSTGLAWSLLAVERLASILDGSYGTPQGYSELLAEEADRIETLIEAAHLAMHDFELFVAVTFLYFASVSFVEVRQRLLDQRPQAPPHAWTPFLDAGVTPGQQLFKEATKLLRNQVGASEFSTWVLKSIAPFNIAGLGDPARRNLFPVDLDSLVEKAPLLGFSRRELQAALPRLRGRV